ncbi:MAG TPA: sigma-70 family RNA polymerase sigma factor [Terriglobia bacterium]|nr:sigma-70 family RNA polymerase sigma factor [Terriglobia bacterium]
MNGSDAPRPAGPAPAGDDLGLLRARAGDGDALGQLFAPHLRYLYRSAFRIVGRAEDAEDALQDGLLLAVRKLRTFENRSRFSTWLNRIVVNAALMQRRRKVRQELHLVRPGESTDGELSMAGEIADHGPDPEQIYSRREQSQILQRRVDCLPLSCRAVLWLNAEGLRIREVAARLGMPEGTVKSHLHRGRAVLRSHFADPGGILPGPLWSARGERAIQQRPGD